MNPSEYRPRLAVFPGDGRIVRRDDAVLFDERSTNDDLSRAFMTALSTEAAIETVKALIVEHELAIDPLAIVSWTNAAIDLLVFGDLTISTTARSAPLLSGAASSTWVEHHMKNALVTDLDALEISCGSISDTIDDLSNLQSGSVFANGFKLVPNRDTDTASSAPSEHEIEPGANVHTDPEPEPGYTVTDATDAGEQPELRGEDPTDLTPRDQHTAQQAGPSLVEVVSCANGHPNRPRSTKCSVCAAEILTDGRVSLAPQPLVGRLQFDDGREVLLDRAVVIGRRPARAGDRHTIELMMDEVSRQHAIVDLDGWDVLLRDLGSRNGTFVTDPDSDGPIRLEEGVDHLLESGVVIHLGSPDASFTFFAPGQTSTPPLLSANEDSP